MHWIDTFKQVTNDLLFPARCGRCHREGHFWCLAENQLPWPRCLHCRAAYHPDRRLKSCRTSLPLLVVGHYANPELRASLQLWKYQSYWAISDDWARFLGELAVAQRLIQTDSSLVPIPLHRTRLRQRGFNQATVLARGIAQTTHQPINEVLTRPRATQAQAQLPLEERAANIQGAFEVLELGNDRSVWLVDDVITTGATIAEAQRTLTRRGWRVDGVFTVAIADQ